MKYYAGHESTYRRLEAEGASCWDRTAFDAFYMRPFLEDALARMGRQSGRALDLGCGTGPVACVLAERGYDEVLGVDLSPTALRMGERAAAERKLGHLRFELHYVLELADDLAGQERFDLIVDSHCLHCLIYDTDRARFFDNVRRLLQPSGAFVVETMARHARVDFGADFVLDDDGVLWRKYADGDPADTRILRGEPHHPNRRVRAPDELEAEVKAAGFAVDFVRASEQQESPGDPLNWQAILRLPMVCS